MIELKGKHNTAKVFIDNIDEKSTGQILDLLNKEEFKDSKIRIMPDTHAGAGCVIGLSMTITDKVVPNLVGVDIGCGVLAVNLGDEELDLKKLDKVINKNIPSGFNIRHKAHKNADVIDFENVKADIKEKRARLSMGTLGGGNHFISVEQDKVGNNFLLIHTGSRHFGLEIANYYQNLALDLLNYKNKKIEEDAKIIIDNLKNEGRHQDIEETLKNYYKENSYAPTQVDKDLAFITGQDMDNYLNDMEIAQRYAYLNRRTIAEVIIEKMGLGELESFVHFDTVHNYIDLDNMILRKGAISAKQGEHIMIPINMRDGSIFAIGKGNEDWNYTAPHGAGRLYGRRQARETFNLDEFKETMEGIYSTSISNATLDECPMAYKNIDDIVDNIQDTADIVVVLKPIYNFKAS